MHFPLDQLSFTINAHFDVPGNTPSWGTALGQKQPYPSQISEERRVFLGHLFEQSLHRWNWNEDDVKLGRGGGEQKEIPFACVIDKCKLVLHANGSRESEIVLSAPFILLVVVDNSDAHKGRYELKWSPTTSLFVENQQYTNEVFFEELESLAGENTLSIFSFSFDSEWLELNAVSVSPTAYRLPAELKAMINENRTPSKYGHEDLLSQSFLESRELTPILSGLAAKKNIILQGPPGTGKTYIAKRLAYALMEEEAKDRVEVVQFHQSYSYEDFIQGFRPKENGGFEPRDGVFLRFCEKARRDPGRDYFFLIDEINRGNLSKIFGELMMLIEADKRGESNRVQLTYSKEGEHFSIPANVHIIGTMNTADRSLAMVDYALRRRFAFFHMPPQFNDKFEAYLQEEHSISASMVKRIVAKLTTLNKTIERDDNLGDGFEIGHSYFCTDVPKGSDEETWYAHIVDHEIGPQLLEYWFDDKQQAEAQIKLLKA